MDTYAQIAKKIIEQQETIIGPVAIEQAKQISGLQVASWEKGKHEVKVSGYESGVIDKLVQQYKELFGQISVEVCKEAAGPLMTKLNSEKQKVPKTLA